MPLGATQVVSAVVGGGLALMTPQFFPWGVFAGWIALALPFNADATFP